jgi:SAM-dependent methyltransferase
MILNHKKLRDLHQAAKKPPLFEKTERSFWTDPYVSNHVLNAHLDPSTDDASRRPQTIKKSTRWIAEKTGGGAGRRLLDLGCGPGLYCSEFCRLGYDVTGIDFSKTSIERAERNARESGEQIVYMHDDFVAADLPGGFDIVTMIYGAFCVLSNDERDLLLWKLRKILKPGGYFFFDVFTEAYEESHRLETDWYLQAADGFWSPDPHMVLEQSFRYPDQAAYLNQYFVLSANAGVKKYHIWHHYYSRKTIAELVTAHKLEVREVCGDLAGAPFDTDGAWIGLVARRAD